MTSAGSDADLPETIPARMLNEFVYCPRLFHLEWVQGRFATSSDVEEGLYVHRVVDSPGGTQIPTPEDASESDGGVARSVWITSEPLGVSARIDILEVGDGGVVPVDYKKGHPDKTGRPWPADETQSVLQALVLRDAGYRVPKAQIWYAETRQRVDIPLTEELEQRVRDVVQEARRVASRDAAPPPLENSPKCPRCSLVGICLPDEVNALRHARTGVTRRHRVIPSDPDPQPLYIQAQGATVSVRGGRLDVFHERERIHSARLIDVGQLCLQGNVTVSSQAVRELMSREIPICWFSYGGWFSGIAHGLPGKNVDLRRTQFTVSSDRALAVARRMISGKIKNSRTLLRRNSRVDVATECAQLSRLAADALEASGFPSLLGLEGTAARIYFSQFTGMLTLDTDVLVDQFDVNGRRRRPPPDPVNALLSFVYSLLVKDITVTLTAIGFDPYFGVFHRPRFGRPALALDLAEEFRPLVGESLVLQVINNGEVRASDFLLRAGACQLEATGRRAVLRAYERRMAHEIRHPLFGYRVSYRRAVEVQARLLAAHMLGETDEYVAFATR